VAERHWAVVIPSARFEEERLYASSHLRVDGAGPAVDGAAGPAPGDRVALIADAEPQVLFGLGRVVGPRYGSDVSIRYERRLFDASVAVPVPAPVGVSELTRAAYAALAASVSPAPPLTRFLVTLSLPIEATSPAEAVREFWTYLDTLGPRELPTFVSPAADELAMQAFVLGAEANLDPEEA
jgi:hypothetical protein